MSEAESKSGRRGNFATCYAVTYIRLAEAAKELGYALTLHGSMTRDLDLVAVPWAEEVAPPEALAERIIRESGGFLPPHESDAYFLAGCPSNKPHGRLGWTIHLGGGPYIDLSVIPVASMRERSIEECVALVKAIEEANPTTSPESSSGIAGRRAG